MKNHRIVQCTCLGNQGRFGNQIFQYIFARTYAEVYNATLEIPEWVGEKIFKNVAHQRPSCRLMRTGKDVISWGSVNIDLFGYFQKRQFINFLSTKKVRRWLQFKDEWVKIFKKNDYSIVAHLRRGDYVEKYSEHYCIVSKESYLKACETYNLPIDKIVWLSEETQKHCSELDNDLQFLPDFFSMINADVLLRANSTFSIWAGFFNKFKVYSPVVGNVVGLSDVNFIKNNSAAISPRSADFILK